MGSDIPIGGLLFLSGPIVGAILMRKYAGEGWGSSGLNFRASSKIYQIGVFALPITFALQLLIGKQAGAVTFGASATIGVGLTSFFEQLLPRLIFAFCEEFGWRGYLTPKLQDLGFSRLKNHLLVGTVWAIWHTPLILATSDYTVLKPVVFIPLFYSGVLAMAVLFGELRLRSNSIWPVVLAHGILNALGFTFLTKDFMAVKYPAIFSPNPASVLFILLFGSMAVLLFKRPLRNHQ